jgi:hypothetical protein
MPTHFLQTRTSFTDNHREIFANVICRSHLSTFRGSPPQKLISTPNETGNPYDTRMITTTVGESEQPDKGQWTKTSEQYLKRQLHWAWPLPFNHHGQLLGIPMHSKANDSWNLLVRYNQCIPWTMGSHITHKVYIKKKFKIIKIIHVNSG